MTASSASGGLDQYLEGSVGVITDSSALWLGHGVVDGQDGSWVFIKNDPVAAICVLVSATVTKVVMIVMGARNARNTCL